MVTPDDLISADAKLDTSKNSAIQRDDEEDDSESDAEGSLGITKELLDEIRSTKQNNPGMFVSAWQEDDHGVREANLNDRKINS
ncbi:hypothetical protein KIN20_000738 [Parelaphostrongylus tenuis]|uniref:Uncharacterized protein n=1 Tax=Parelaphostrongylus tenuis TaxID=148309 RepID=A0AAD5MBP5_PARTN|nr:hypothetical protein KIN20_000738 [Parelaphostrongylus tenuis]